MSSYLARKRLEEMLLLGLVGGLLLVAPAVAMGRCPRSLRRRRQGVETSFRASLSRKSVSNDVAHPHKGAHPTKESSPHKMLHPQGSSSSHKALHPPKDLDHKTHHHHRHLSSANTFFLGVKLSAAMLFDKHTSDPAADLLWGGGIFVEWALADHMLELELETRLTRNRSKMVLPFELLVKFPFAVHPMVSLYLGVGPVLSLELTDAGEHRENASSASEPSWEIGFGGAAVAGMDLWLHGSWGLAIEANYGLVYIAESWTHEVGVNVGVIMRW